VPSFLRWRRCWENGADKKHAVVLPLERQIFWDFRLALERQIKQDGGSRYYVYLYLTITRSTLHIFYELDCLLGKSSLNLLIPVRPVQPNY
jgi:hypothetical protein